MQSEFHTQNPDRPTLFRVY